MTSLIAVLAGCNASTQALDTAAPAKNQAKSGTQTAAAASPANDQKDEKDASAADETGGAKIIREPSKVTQKGNYIAVVVNGQPITNYDIQRRVKFRQLRRLKPSKEEATKELIDQELKLQAATLHRTKASDDEVDRAFANFAKSNKASPQKIASDLDRFGVGAKHFKEFIRTQISWNRTVGSKLRAETRNTSQSEALFEIRKSGAEKPETTEYTLQQIIFVIPKDKRQERLKTRKAEAIAFSQRFTGCKDSFEMAKGLRDVAVKELGRRLLEELPENWKEEVKKGEVGKTVGPQESDLGVELLAICNSRIVDDDRAAQIVTQSHAFGSLEDEGSKAADEMLADLHKSAVIVYK